jgi:hypothetical protein
LTNALAEGLNSLTVVLKGAAGGLKNLADFLTRVLSCLGKPDCYSASSRHGNSGRTTLSVIPIHKHPLDYVIAPDFPGGKG